MKLVPALFFFIACCVAAFSQNPCDDPRYLALKKKNLDSMSQREFEYFMLKERYCFDETSRSASKVQCTLAVIIDSAVIEGKEREFKVFVDDVELIVKGRGLSCPVSTGIHKVSLFSLEEIDDFEKKINRRIMTNDSKSHFFGIGVMETRLRQMKNTVKTFSAVAGKRVTVHYRFTCDTGKTGRCADDGWIFTPETN
jgi:hypothetical protein